MAFQSKPQGKNLKPGLFRLCQKIAYTSPGEDDARVTGVILNFLAQAADVNL